MGRMAFENVINLDSLFFSAIGEGAYRGRVAELSSAVEYHRGETKPRDFWPDEVLGGVIAVAK